MSSNIDFLMDFESLGLYENSVLLSIGCTFMREDKLSESNNEIFNGAISDGFYHKLDVRSQLKMGRKIDKETADWWKDQGPETKEVLSPSGDDVELERAILEFHQYLRNNGFSQQSNIWGRGYVEPMWYFGLCRDLDIDPIIKYWQFRDARTSLMLELHPAKFCKTLKPDGYVPHNALHDAAFLILQMVDPFGEK